MNHDPHDPRALLAATIADALAQADQLGEITAGCHLSAAQECLLAQRQPWSSREIEAAFAPLDGRGGPAVRAEPHPA